MSLSWVDVIEMRDEARVEGRLRLVCDSHLGLSIAEAARAPSRPFNKRVSSWPLAVSLSGIKPLFTAQGAAVPVAGGR